MLNKIRLALGTIFLLIMSCIFVLYSGIKIDSFSFSNFFVSQFYIKMDKKLILDIGEIEIKTKKSKTQSSLDDIKKDLYLLPKILNFFQNITVEKFKIENNQFKIIISDNNVYLDSKFINVASKIDISSKQVVFDLYSLYLKDLDLLFEGKVKVDYFKEKLNYFGNVYYDGIQANLNLDLDKKLAKFYLQSEPFESLRFLKKHLDLPEVAESWMYDNVKGDIVLKDFYGEFDLVKNEILEKTLTGHAQILGAKIRFHKDVEAINTKRVDVAFNNDTLHFDLIEPKFKNKDINGSFVTIHHLTSEKNGEVEVNIKTKDRLDKDVLDILKAYNIKLPVIQKSGITDANLSLKFPYFEEKPMITKGLFQISDSQIAISNFAFNTQKATVILDGTNIEIKDADFKYEDMIDAFVNLSFDTKTLKSSGTALINSFSIKKDENEKLVDIKNKPISLDMDFNKDVEINLKDLSTNLKVADLIYVNIDDLSKIYPYSKLLQDISAKEGNLFLEIKDEKNLKFKSYVKGLNFPIQKDGKNIDELELQGSIENQYISLQTTNEDIKFEMNGETKIYLKNLDIFIDTAKQKNDFTKNINLYLQNSNLNIDNSSYQIKNAEIFIKKGQIDFDAVVKNPKIPLKKDNKDIEELSLFGIYKDDFTKINTKNNDLILELKKDSMSLNLDGYDISYSTNDKSKYDYKSVDIIGKNSNVVIDNNHKILADNYEVRIKEDSKFAYLKYKQTQISFKEYENKKVDIFADELNEEFINAIIGKNIVKGGNILFFANGKITDLNGKIIIEDSNVEDLAILNNLLIFIHTSPALINPLLAIPSVVGMATNSGFNLTAYKIVNGAVEFNYNSENNLIDIKKLLTIGNGIDFDGTGRVDLNNLTLDTNLKLIFLKDYSSIIGGIPVINYVLLGNNNRVETLVNVNGDLNNPHISTNLTKDTFNIPVNIAKRLFNSPSAFVDFLNESNLEGKKEIELMNKPLN